MQEKLRFPWWPDSLASLKELFLNLNFESASSALSTIL